MTIQILGISSGQLIKVTQHQLETLLNLDYVQWSFEYDYWVFRDAYLDEMKKFLKPIVSNKIIVGDKVITATGKEGKVVKIIEYYNGEKVNGRILSKIYNIGNTLFIIQFNPNNTGIYTFGQLKKVDKINEGVYYNKPYTNILTIELVGLPSGQIIEIDNNEAQYLKEHHLIKWNGSRTGMNEFIGYSFNDKDEKKIMNLLYELF